MYSPMCSIFFAHLKMEGLRVGCKKFENVKPSLSANEESHAAGRPVHACMIRKTSGNSREDKDGFWKVADRQHGKKGTKDI
jgi:hypothetical protein